MNVQFRVFLNPVEASIRRFFKAFGYEIVKTGRDYGPDEAEIIGKVRLYTGTSAARLAGLIGAVNYLTKNKIAGDFVECGVWRGGSMMAAMLTLLKLGDTSRHFHLFDTYEGMPTPTNKDVSDSGLSAVDYLAMQERKDSSINWLIASVEDVRRNVFSTGYPQDKIHFIKGKVEDTLPAQAPESTALLRLDTDWYESTRHEMIHLYPRLRPNGVLILDDYGYWQGSREAVDEYFAAQKITPLLNKLDHPGRIAVKPA